MKPEVTAPMIKEVIEYCIDILAYAKLDIEYVDGTNIHGMYPVADHILYNIFCYRRNAFNKEIAARMKEIKKEYDYGSIFK